MNNVRIEHDLNSSKMKDDLNFFKMEDDLLLPLLLLPPPFLPPSPYISIMLFDYSERITPPRSSTLAQQLVRFVAVFAECKMISGSTRKMTGIEKFTV